MYALDRTCHGVVVSFEVLSENFGKLKYPKALASALYHKKKWKTENCARVYDDTVITPYKNKKTFVTQFVRHVLDHEELWRFGALTNNLRAQRLSLHKSRAVQRARRLRAKANSQENTC